MVLDSAGRRGARSASTTGNALQFARCLMSDTPFIARGFHRRRAAGPPNRLPPGQYETKDFPVLSAGPTPRVSLATWDFTLRDEARHSIRWTWDELQALAHETPTVDIHCVTKWSKFDMRWEGISVDTLL